MDQPVQQQCAQVLAALTWTVESPETPNTWAVLLGEAHLNPSTLALIMSELTEQVCSLAFQPLENFYPSVFWGPLWRSKVNLSCCHNLEGSLKLCNLSLLIMSVSSTPQTMPKHTKFVFLPQKHQKWLCSLFLEIIFKYHLPTEIFSLASQKATFLVWPIPLACDFKRTKDGL